MLAMSLSLILVNELQSAERIQRSLRVELYSSIISGVSPQRALAASDPLASSIGAELGITIQQGIRNGETDKDLMEFGKALDSGKVQLGAVWGIEYGWLKQRYRRLDVLVLASPGKQFAPPAQIMVSRAFDGAGVGALRGRHLATFRGSTLMDKLFLVRTLEEMGGPKNVGKFFAKVTLFDTARGAILAVNRGDADCVVLGAPIYAQLVNNQPGISLIPVKTSKPFPESVIIGRKDHVEAIRVGLWSAIQRQLLDASNNAYGQQSLAFWKLNRYTIPQNPAFARMIEERIREYPFEELTFLPKQFSVLRIDAHR